jgi:phage-related protein
MKPVDWVGSSLSDLRRFDADARSEAGYQLDKVQRGEEPTDWKPMPSVGMGVNEIRIHGATEDRVIYIAKFAEAVYVLHAFTKKTQQTSPKDIEVARKRFAQLIRERTGQ